MELAHLVAGLPGLLAVAGDTSAHINQIVADSRQVTPGALFVAYRGTGVDGHRFIDDAIRRGAAAIVAERLPAGLSVPGIEVTDGRAALGWLAAAWYGHPSRELILAGITGTDGKTTTSNLLFSILNAAGRRSGLISTVNAVIGDRTYDTGLHTTTPDALDVQRYLAQMRDVGTEVAVLETTSHGLAQQRVAGCRFDVAVITNITHEHLDFHGSYEAYREAKALLFRSLDTPAADRQGSAAKRQQAKTAVLNRDDESYPFLAAIPVERTITYGIRDQLSEPALGSFFANLTATGIAHKPAGCEFEIRIGSGLSDQIPPILPLVSPLTGTFNVYNILAAASAAFALGISPAAIHAGVAAFSGVPGRMERIDRGQDFVALVDFAHTPNALGRALETARGLANSGGRVIVVFGCAGLRDREKRRLMGETAADLADLTLITAEDPRTEELAAIMEETAAALLRAGKREGRDFLRVPDRQEAILRAVQAARPGDVVIVCGKGHEQSMCFGATEHPWQDQRAVAWALDTLRGAAPADPPFRLPTAHL